jgi:hypothetical protein
MSRHHHLFPELQLASDQSVNDFQTNHMGLLRDWLPL